MYLWFSTLTKSHLKTAGLEEQILISPSMDEASEIQEGLKDLDDALVRSTNPRSGPYWPKIKSTLLEESSSKDVDEAIKEWDRDGFPYISREQCQLCGKNPIKFCFPIKNKVTGSHLVVGCECIHNYLQIGGYETPKALKKSLITQLNALKKYEKGESSSEELEAVKNLGRLEGEVRSRLAVISPKSFDLDEYFQALNSVLTICNSLGLQDPAVRVAASCLKATYRLKKFIDRVRKTQKFVGYNLGVFLEKLLAKRDPVVKVDLLESFLTELNALFGGGLPNDVISRAWGAIESGKHRLLVEVEAKCTKGKAELEDKCKDSVNVAKPYGYLSFLLSQGVKSLKASFDSQLERVRSAVEAEDFVERMRDSEISSILSFNFYPDLANSDDPAQRGAYRVIEFIDAVTENSAVDTIAEAIEDTYKLGGVQVRDVTGVRVALLRAADDDSILDIDVLGAEGVGEFARMIRARDPKALGLIQKEVDEVANLLKTTGNQRVYEAMGDQLGFDVERVFKLYTADKPFELDFCTRILDSWLDGRLTELSPSRLNNIKQQIAFKGRTKEVQNSMWKKLLSKLTTKAPLN